MILRGQVRLGSCCEVLTEDERANATIDWTIRKNVRAHVKQNPRDHGYPLDKQEKATLTVLEQAEVRSETWVAV